MNNKRKIHSIKYNFLMNILLTVSQIIFPIVTLPYVLRTLQVAGNGKVAFATSFAQYFILTASLGIPTYGIRECAKVRDDKNKLEEIVHDLLTINGVMTIIVSIVYYVSVFTVPRLKVDSVLFSIYGLNVILNMFSVEWLYRALEQYDYITVRSIVFKLISLVLMFWLVHKPEDYIIYGGINVFATTGSYIFNFIRLRKIVSWNWKYKPDFKRHIKPIAVLFGQVIAVSIYTNLDTVMLGFITDDTFVGYYNTAAKVKVLLYSCISALANVLLPRMSYYINKGKEAEFKKLMVKALNATLIISVPTCLFFILFARDTIQIIAGNNYEYSIRTMQILCAAIIPMGITGILGTQILTPLNREKKVLISVAAGAVVDFILNLLWIKTYKANGAAFATTITEYIVLLVQLYFAKDILKGTYKELSIVKVTIATIVSTVFALLFSRFNITYIIMGIATKGIVFFGIYSFIMIAFKEPLIMNLLHFYFDKIRSRNRKD